ncbi:MAG: hypothetical protein ACE15C_16115 [Phycisphaerae bacterium]
MRRNGLKIASIFVVVVVLLSGLISWWAFLRREHTRWTETVQLGDSTTAQVHVEHSKRVFWSFGHAGGIGGGDERYRLQVTVSGKQFTWEGGDERPFAFASQGETLYMAVLDRGDMSHVRFRYYRSGPDNRLLEIQPAEFPKALAVQNAWLQGNDARLLRQMDPQDYWFRHSLTAKMWLHLVKSVEYYADEEPSAEFVAEYKKKHLTGP